MRYPSGPPELGIYLQLGRFVLVLGGFRIWWIASTLRKGDQSRPLSEEEFRKSHEQICKCHLEKQEKTRLVSDNRFSIRIAVVEPKPVFCRKSIWNNLFEFLRFSRESLLFKIKTHMVQVIEE